MDSVGQFNQQMANSVSQLNHFNHAQAEAARQWPHNSLPPLCAEPIETKIEITGGDLLITLGIGLLLGAWIW